MSLSLDERSRVRYHLGYMEVQPAAAIVYGIPRPVQTLFLVEEAMTMLMETGVNRIRRVLGIMDGIEVKLVEAQDRLAADALGDLKIRAQETEMLEKEYQRWGWRLADILGVPIYSFSTKYRNMGTGAGSIPVR